MKRVVLVLALSLAAVMPRTASTAGPASPTIEQFLMPGTPTEVVAAKKAERIAWTAYEHGLRNVRPDIVEAGRQMGTTPSQLLWQVKLPLAMPVVMLGVNQTIMAALSMVAIAALVGTRDLGQQVYISLENADAGQGFVSGISIALLAMISDRTIRAWVERQQPAARK